MSGYGSGFAGTGPATSDGAGTLSADLYAGLTGTPPTDPTTDLSTGTAATYAKATISNVTSSIDGGTIANITCRYCYCNEHVTAGHKLVPLLCFPGFGTAYTQYDDTFLERLASYLHATTGRAFLVIALSLRGRGAVSGTNDAGIRESTDALDALAAVVAAVGVAEGPGVVFGTGTSAALYGFSTGAHNAGQFACQYPDHTLAVIVEAMNWDLWRSPTLSYGAIKDGSTRTSLTTWGGARGAGTDDEIAPWIARDFSAAIASYMNLPGAYHLFAYYDRDEVAGLIPDGDPFVARIQEGLVATSKIHPHPTQTGDTHRVQHDSGVNGAGSIWYERTWVRHALEAEEWELPATSPEGGLPVLGYLRPRTLGWEAWTGLNASPKPIADLATPTNLSGGTQHAGTLHYRTGRQFTFRPATSKGGFLQVLTDVGDDRIEPITPGTPCEVDLDRTPPIATLADLGFDNVFFSDAGALTGDPVTDWAPEIGATHMAPPGGSEPTQHTDGDGVVCVRFTRTSDTVGQRMIASLLPINPHDDYTMIAVYSKPDTTTGQIVNVDRVESYDALSLNTAGGSTTAVFYRSSTYTIATVNQSGVGGHTISTGAKHVSVVRRLGDTIGEQLDGGAWNESDVIPARDTFPSPPTGTFKTVFGAGSTPDGVLGHSNVDLYCVAFATRALSDSEIAAAVNLLRDRLIFGSPVAGISGPAIQTWRLDRTIHGAGSFDAVPGVIYQVDLSGGAVTVVPPAASYENEGQSFRVIQVVAGVATLTIDPASGNVEGAATLALTGIGTPPLLDTTVTSLGAGTFGWKSG